MNTFSFFHLTQNKKKSMITLQFELDSIQHIGQIIDVTINTSQSLPKDYRIVSSSNARY